MNTFMQVSVRNLTFTYDGSYTPVFQNVSEIALQPDERQRLLAIAERARSSVSTPMKTSG